jgi:hypothetical protein
MAAATAAVNGYMTSTYASKLDGIAAGATNVTNTNQLTNGAGFITSSGTAANVSGIVAVANGGTGATTAAAARTNLGATTLGGNLFTLANVAAIAFPRFNADNTVSSLDAATFRTAIGAGTSSTTGTVTSVSGTGTVSGLSLSGTVTTSGNITLGGTLSVTPSNFASQTANTFLAAPNGAAGTPTFRAVVAADIPTLNQNTTGSSASCTGNAATATTASNATTAGGFTPSATAGTANRIVVADSGGYINNNYFNSTDNVATGMTYVMGKFGDNYLRSATAATVATFISGQTMNISGSSTSCSGNAATATTATNVSGGTASVTTLTTSSTVTLNGGTANTIPYLNASKVLTTGNLSYNGASSGASYSGATYLGFYQIASDASSSVYRAIYLDARNESGAAVGNELWDINIDGSTAVSWSTQLSGTRTDRRAERMRIDSSGNWCYGTNSTNISNGGFTALPSGNSSYFGIGHGSGTVSGSWYHFFQYAGSTIGTIYQNGTTNVGYATSSDYRLKENIAPMKNAMALISKLKPVTYTWKSDGSSGHGFIAHELQEIVPEAVYGIKDEVDENGNPKYQGIDTSFVVGYLTCAIQEQQKQIDEQKTLIQSLIERITALESK